MDLTITIDPDGVVYIEAQDDNDAYTLIQRLDPDTITVRDFRGGKPKKKYWFSRDRY